MILVAIWAPINLAYQAAHKPSELLAPFGELLMKSPSETWQSYAPLFHRYATATVSPELLAALAQVESAGDPLVTTYWRWRISLNPFGIYRPASTSVGMFQMTDGAFAEARQYCIRDHRVAADSGDALSSPCGLSDTYSRIVPSDAVELAAIYLDRKLTALTHKRKGGVLTAQQRDRLAAMIHLCGAGPAEDFLRYGLHVAPGQRCGDQDVAAYLARVDGFERQFAALARAGEP
ncbi:MAG TPA: hypothetical protein VKV32_11920 [Stellaceae bacterium]|nr:hypothetical protein [Stellaceae bacterium]